MKYRLMIMALAAGALAAACGGGSSNPSPVGTACSSDEDCGGYENAACITALRPLEDLVEDNGDPANTALRELALPFPGGSCGTNLDTPCDSDAQCGEGGGCFVPFEGVDDMTIDNLNMLGLPFDLHEFATLGTCLATCTADSDCRTDEGYTCIVPLTAFLTVINPDYTKTYCAQDVDVSALLR